MWELDCEESWAPKNWCFWTVVLEKTLESPLDCKEIQPVHSEGYQLWDFFGRTDAKAETPVLWPLHVKSWLIGKDSDAGRDWGQEDKGVTEDEMAGWHHWLDGRESEWTPGVGDGQGGLACCDSWGHKESDTTERLNWTEGYRNMNVFNSLWRRWFWLRNERYFSLSLHSGAILGVAASPLWFWLPALATLLLPFLPTTVLFAHLWVALWSLGMFTSFKVFVATSPY